MASLSHSVKSLTHPAQTAFAALDYSQSRRVYSRDWKTASQY